MPTTPFPTPGAPATGAPATDAKRRGGGSIAAILAGLVAVGVLAAPGSLAYLQDQAAADGITLATGSADLTLTAGSGSAPAIGPTGLMQLIWPASPATVRNSGSVPLSVTVEVASSDATAGGFGAATTFAVWLSDAACVVPSQVVPGMWVGTALSPAATVIGTLAPGASSRLCVAAGLPTTAPASAQAGQGGQFTITLTGTQVAS